MARKNLENCSCSRGGSALFCECRERCPNCGSDESKHEDNGCSPRSVGYTILCTACGHQWSPNDG
jgi:hypothetical protein